MREHTDDSLSSKLRILALKPRPLPIASAEIVNTGTISRIISITEVLNRLRLIYSLALKNILEKMFSIDYL